MFYISIQSPFERNPKNYENCTADKAMELYKTIDWKDIWAKIEASGSSQENDFYYFEIKRTNALDTVSLCISGYIGFTICIGFFRPKTVTKKSFFKTKEVLKPNFQTQMDDMEIPFGLTCLEALLRDDIQFLEQNMYDKELG